MAVAVTVNQRLYSTEGNVAPAPVSKTLPGGSACAFSGADREQLTRIVTTATSKTAGMT